jgi:hypothetical protein
MMGNISQVSSPLFYKCHLEFLSINILMLPHFLKVYSSNFLYIMVLSFILVMRLEPILRFLCI